MTKVIFSFFGPPGSGKGTLAERLIKDLGFEVLSTGNLCRFHIAQGTPFGKELQELVHKGHLIPDELITSMVEQWFLEKKDCGKTIVLDGYPRTGGQAAAFVDILKKHPDFCFRVVFVELADDEIVKRLLGRRVCDNKSCQTVYPSSFTGSVCERCASPLARRVDDQEGVIRERLRLYPAHKQSILEAYSRLGIKLEELNVAGLSIDEVVSTFKAML